MCPAIGHKLTGLFRFECGSSLLEVAISMRFEMFFSHSTLSFRDRTFKKKETNSCQRTQSP